MPVKAKYKHKNICGKYAPGDVIWFDNKNLSMYTKDPVVGIEVGVTCPTSSRFGVQDSTDFLWNDPTPPDIENGTIYGPITCEYTVLLNGTTTKKFYDYEMDNVVVIERGYLWRRHFAINNYVFLRTRGVCPTHVIGVTGTVKDMKKMLDGMNSKARKHKFASILLRKSKQADAVPTLAPTHTQETVKCSEA